jgi:hypothetical protein
LIITHAFRHPAAAPHSTPLKQNGGSHRPPLQIGLFHFISRPFLLSVSPDDSSSVRQHLVASHRAQHLSSCRHIRRSYQSIYRVGKRMYFPVVGDVSSLQQQQTSAQAPPFGPIQMAAWENWRTVAGVAELVPAGSAATPLPPSPASFPRQLIANKKMIQSALFL